MKGKEIVDPVIEATNMAIEVELPNGQRMTTKNYRFDSNKRGEPVLVILAGKSK